MFRAPVLLAACLILSSPTPYRFVADMRAVPHQYVAMVMDESRATGVPAEIISGIAAVESGWRPYAIGPDGLDRGMFQLRSLYDEERAAKWGRFDPFRPHEAVRIAARILAEDYRRLGTWDEAIAAFRQGARGVRKHGAARMYLEEKMGT